MKITRFNAEHCQCCSKAIVCLFDTLKNQFEPRKYFCINAGLAIAIAPILQVKHIAIQTELKQVFEKRAMFKPLAATKILELAKRNMKDLPPLADDRKLLVTYRVEPGCLGPDGKTKIAEFCTFTQERIQSLGSDYVAWNIVSRDDKTLAEVQYSLIGKKLTLIQAEQYLAIFGISLDDFENRLDDRLTLLIDDFLEL